MLSDISTELKKKMEALDANGYVINPLRYKTITEKINIIFNFQGQN